MFPIKPIPEINTENNASDPCPQSSSQKFISFAFGKIVSLWPADTRDWALAMQAELPQMESTQQSLQWLAGGIMSLGKAWWNGALSSDNKKDLTPVKKPGILAALVTAAALALLLIPSANQGLHAVLMSWEPNRYDAYQAQLVQIARKAESQGDAKTMAFAAMRMGSFQDNVFFSNKAVALDPSLTWILSFGPVWDAYLPESRDWPVKLAAWDPGNSVAYLTQAEIRGAELNRDTNYSMDAASHDSQWLDAGRKAMESPRYDSYQKLRLQLDREVVSTVLSKDPDAVAVGVARSAFGWTNLRPASVYSEKLLTDAKAAAQRGDRQTAIRDVWAVAHFGEIVRSQGQTEGERVWSAGYLRPAYTILQPLLAAEGRTDEAKLLSYELDAIKKGSPATQRTLNFWSDSSDGWGRAASVVMNICAFGTVLLTISLLFSGIYLVAARFSPESNAAALYRTACCIGRFGPTGLLASIAVLAAVYLPAANAVSEYLSQPITNTTMRNLMDHYYSVYYVRHIFRPAPFSPHHEIFWMFVIVSGVLAILTIIGRNILNRTPRQKVATA